MKCVNIITKKILFAREIFAAGNFKEIFRCFKDICLSKMKNHYVKRRGIDYIKKIL